MLAEPIIAAVITATVTSVGAYIAYRNRQSERVKLTRDLYNQFFNMFEDRAEAWFWLEELAKQRPRATFEQLWRASHAEDRRRFHSFYKVAGFWFLVFQLHRAGQLDKRLARTLLAYEFYFWSKQAHQLIDATRAQDLVFPEALQSLDDCSWLLPNGYTPK